MTKTNEFVGVDDQFIPESEQKKTYVQEPIIGAENTEKVRGVVKDGANYITSDKGKQKIRSGVKLAKNIIIARIVIACLFFALVIALTVFIAIKAFNGMDEAERRSAEATREIEEREKKAQDEFNRIMEDARGHQEQPGNTEEDIQRQYENTKKDTQEQYDESADDIQKMINETKKKVQEGTN